MVSGSSTTPSSSASMTARMPARGVRRSCDTHATSSRRDASSARSRARASSRRVDVSSSSSRRQASSCGAGTALPAAPLRVPSPSVRATSASERLTRPTRRPKRRAATTPTAPAASSMTASAPRSWSDRNIAWAPAHAPTPTATTATSATAAACTPMVRVRRVWSTSAPTAAATAAVPAASATSCRVSVLTSPSPSWVEPVSDSPHGGEVPGRGWVAFDLLPQPSNVDGHGGGVAVGVPPHELQELLAPEGVAGLAGEEREQVELARGERDEVSVDPYLAGAEVDEQTVETDG